MGVFSQALSMTAAVGSRVIVLAVLALFGVGVGLGGTTLGVASPTPDAGQDVELTVSESTVTLSDSNRTTVVAEDIESAETVEITQADGRISVRANDSLTDDDRDRAITIVRRNETIRNALDGMEEAGFEVDPVVRLDASAVQKTEVDAETVVVNGTNASGGASEYRLRNVTIEEDGDSVRITRDRTYVDDRVVVRVRDGSAELRYSVRVDLATESVIEISDYSGSEAKATPPGVG